MSTVTNLILATGFEDSITTAMINKFFPVGTLLTHGFVCSTRGECVDQSDIGSDEKKDKNHWWYGGTKVMEANLWAGAFNNLDLSALREHLRTLPWEEPRYVQLFIKEQEDDTWRLESLFEPMTLEKMDAIIDAIDENARPA